ncbi:hypothetical protein HanPSC8_Chr04g0140031 [Helianthus annuus]|nr:hypothetical protein HanPSC8_Chr04g0140031 [Helianthus annuus]
MSSTQLSLRSIKAAFLTKLVFAFISISKLHFLFEQAICCDVTMFLENGFENRCNTLLYVVALDTNHVRLT